MLLQVLRGAVVVLDVVGHSASNGAVIPEGSTVALTSNDPTVATVPDTVQVPAGGAAELVGVPVAILAAGTTDIHLTVTAPDGTVYEDTGTLQVDEPQPGLLRVELVLREVPA